VHCNFQPTAQSKQLPIGEKFAQFGRPGQGIEILEEACLKKGRHFFCCSPPYFVKRREVLETAENFSI
jgi:hypothetical protein